MLESGLIRSLVAKLPQRLLLVLREFHVAGKERCEQGYEWVWMPDVVAPKAYQNNRSYVYM